MIKKNFPTGRVYSKKQTRVTANQHIFKSGLNNIFEIQSAFYLRIAYSKKNWLSFNWLNVTLLYIFISYN